MPLLNRFLPIDSFVPNVKDFESQNFAYRIKKKFITINLNVHIKEKVPVPSSFRRAFFFQKEEMPIIYGWALITNIEGLSFEHQLLDFDQSQGACPLTVEAVVSEDESQELIYKLNGEMIPEITFEIDFYSMSLSDILNPKRTEQEIRSYFATLQKQEVVDTVASAKSEIESKKSVQDAYSAEINDLIAAIEEVRDDQLSNTFDTPRLMAIKAALLVLKLSKSELSSSSPEEIDEELAKYIEEEEKNTKEEKKNEAKKSQTPTKK